MTDNFNEYAQYYDLLYRDKDYHSESVYVSKLLDLCLSKPVEKTSILDLACGTGRHAQELASMGYAVEGSDISAEMVNVANIRSAKNGQPIKFHNESFQTCNWIDRKFDALIAMFSAIGYLSSYQDLALTMSNIRYLLVENGVFIFDFWNGYAVAKNFSQTRIKRAKNGDDTVIRISNTVLDEISQIATVTFDFIWLKSGHIIREFSEVHSIRYYFPQEMVSLMEANGFSVIHRCPFLNANNPIEPDDWNLTYVVRT
jgi:SAM-dependent methyltransferase